MGSGDDEANEPKKAPYPKSIIFIIGNEFCERFSYYGMKAILVLYFRYILGYSENTATQAYHIFSMACYFTPIIGAFIADSLLGKFWTILSISIVYAAGNILLSISAFNGTVALTFIGLTLIALGTGGIKPCVSAFGGDQFKPEQKQQLQQFFSLFYVSINAGSLISTFVTPILRQDVSCFDRSDCYPLAFGVPAVLMLVAFGLFILGKFVTGYVIVPPQKDNVVVMVIKCVFHALGRKLFTKTPRKEHWLEYSDDRYDSKTIQEVKCLMGVLWLYLPLPIFWALFDQQGSRWTLQAIRMNGVLGGFTIKPDQIQVVNPVLIILMIPVFEYVLYPLMNKINFGRPLQRMTLGGLLAGAAFVICAFIQLRLESEQPVKPLAGHNHLALVNGLPGCNVEFMSLTAPPFGAKVAPNVERSIVENLNQALKLTPTGAPGTDCQDITIQVTKTISVKDDQSVSLFITEQSGSIVQDVVIYPNMLSKPEEGGAELFTVFNLKNYNNQTFHVTETNDHLVWHVSEDYPGLGNLDKFEVELKGKDIEMSVGTHKNQLHLEQGGTYVQIISGDINEKVTFNYSSVVDPNSMSVFLQLIQYFVITCAEILFSVTGLEFSYAQAPKSMKSVLTACWLLTVAFGNLIVVIIADLTIFPEQSHEFFFFAGLMFVDIAIFGLMAYYYVPVQLPQEGDEDELTADNGKGVGGSELNLPEPIGNGKGDKEKWMD